MTTSGETLSATGKFIRDTPGAPTLAEAASNRGMRLEHAQLKSMQRQLLSRRQNGMRSAPRTATGA
jgi:hypothetical protein